MDIMKFEATIEIKSNNEIYITPNENYEGFEKFIWENRNESVGDLFHILPF